MIDSISFRTGTTGNFDNDIRFLHFFISVYVNSGKNWMKEAIFSISISNSILQTGLHSCISHNA